MIHHMPLIVVMHSYILQDTDMIINYSATY